MGMRKLLHMVEKGEIIFYVMTSSQRRPRFFNMLNCSFPFNIFLICPDFYYFQGYSIYRDIPINCSTFGSECQFFDIIHFYQHIYEVNKERISHGTLKWVIQLEDDVNFCPLTAEYILNTMALDSINVNLLHLSRGNVGTLIKTSFIEQFIELLKEAHALKYWSNAKGKQPHKGLAFDVLLTVLFDEKKNHSDVYYSRYNMMHHPLVSLNIEAQQHLQNVNAENIVTCDKLGNRWRAKELNYINPYNMQISFEHLEPGKSK